MRNSGEGSGLWKRSTRQGNATTDFGSENSIRRAESMNEEEDLIWKSPPPTKLAVAVKKDSTHALTWALKNRASSGRPITILFVRKPVKFIPTAMGAMPLSQANDLQISAHVEEMKKQTAQFLDSLEQMCRNYEVAPVFRVIESDEAVHKILIHQINETKITNLVLGASSSPSSLLKKATSDLVFNKAPHYCTVTIVSKNYTIQERCARDFLYTSGKMSRPLSTSFDIDRLCDFK